MSKQNHSPQSFVYVTKGGDVELAEHDGKFKRFRKMIAKYGEFVDPRGGKQPMKLDKAWAEKIVDNFKSGVRGYVPVPLGHPKTDAELAEKNKGELIDLEAGEDGLYGTLEIRDTETIEAIESKRIPDTSVAFDDDYQDKSTGKWVGPTLKHVGLVVNPYLKGMTQFEPALSEGASAAVLFSDSVEANGDNNNNEKEEITMATVKNERDFPVEVTYTENDEEKKVTIEPGAEIEVPEDQVEAITKQITDAQKPEEEQEESGDGDDGGELSEAEKKAKELAEREAAAAKKEAELAEREANAEYERLLSEGKIVPAQKNAYIALAAKGSATVELSDGTEKTVSVLLSELFEAAPKGKYLSEEGAGGDDGGDGGDDDVELSEEEKSLAESFGNTPEELAEFKKNGDVTIKNEE